MERLRPELNVTSCKSQLRQLRRDPPPRIRKIMARGTKRIAASELARAIVQTEKIAAAHNRDPTRG